jgi:hypothetical protein
MNGEKVSISESDATKSCHDRRLYGWLTSNPVSIYKTKTYHTVERELVDNTIY